MSIQPLPKDVIAQIKSSIAITSLNGVVCELVKNSLDAGATKIELTVDYGKGSCVIEDDGVGIQPAEFREKAGLGKLYHSSKLNSQTPLHGGRGTFLASLSAMALLTITSHQHLHRSHNTLSMHKSEVVARQVPAPPQHHLATFSHGTRVSVRDLFGNMPVRVKQRAIASEKNRGNCKDWEDLKREIVLLLLSWHAHITITARDTSTGQKLVLRAPNIAWKAAAKVSPSRICNILSQAGLILPDEKDCWIAVAATTPKLSIEGCISLDPNATKHVQFISLGIRPLALVHGHSIFHNEVNRLFINSAFGNEEEVEELDESERARRAKDKRYKSDGYTGKELKGGKKGVDRWPMFYINIQQLDDVRNIDLDNLLDNAKNSLTLIMELLQAMILEFLTKNHFRPKAGLGHRPKQITETSTSAGSDLSDMRKFFGSPAPLSQASEASHKASSSTTKRSALKKAHTSDPLGTNVKFPSFRQSKSQPDSPFDAWSRVKRGTAREEHLKLHSAGVDSSLHPSDIERPFTAPPPVQASSPATIPRSQTADPSRKIAKPLLSKNGKLIRAPFEDVLAHRPTKSVRSCLHKETSQSPEQNPTDPTEDEIIAWINPITKLESRINKRTGLTLPATKTNLTLRSSATSTKSLSSRQNLNRSITSNTTQPSPWLSQILKTWENPIFAPIEISIPQISLTSHDPTQDILHGHRQQCSHGDIDKAFTEISSGIEGRVSKTALRNAEVINQVDNKFILAKLKSHSRQGTEEDGTTMLILIDQHAADERIRIESLLSELCQPPPSSLHPECRVQTTQLDKPLTFEILEKEIKLLEIYKQYFANWGILYKTTNGQPGKMGKMGQVSVYSLPPVVVERCKLHTNLIIELLRTEVYKITDNPSISQPPPSHPSPKSEETQIPNWLSLLPSIPHPLLEMLNSRACRSSIMFNDKLSKEQCEALVSRLGETKFPWFCAHGRPSFMVLAGLEGMGGGIGGGGGIGEGGWVGRRREEGEIRVEGFGRAFGRWRRGLEEDR